MFQLGVKGYITKNSHVKEIFSAIDIIMKGEKYVCDEIKNSLSEQMIGDVSAEHNIKNLSLREIEIIKFMKDGLSSKEISALINISTRTVEVHRHNILKKLNFKNTTSLLNYINNTELNFV